MAAARGAAHNQVTGSQSSGDGRAGITRETNFRDGEDRVCRRSSGGAEVTAGDAVRMIAKGTADEAVNSSANIIPHLSSTSQTRADIAFGGFAASGSGLHILAQSASQAAL